MSTYEARVAERRVRKLSPLTTSIVFNECNNCLSGTNEKATKE